MRKLENAYNGRGKRGGGYNITGLNQTDRKQTKKEGRRKRKKLEKKRKRIWKTRREIEFEKKHAGENCEKRKKRKREIMRKSCGKATWRTLGMCVWGGGCLQSGRL